MSQSTNPNQFVQTWVRPIVFSVDLWLGAIAGTAVGLSANVWSSIKDEVVGLSLASLGLGVAILGVTLTALAILVGLLDDRYLNVLRRAPGGVAGVLAQYRIVGVVSLLTILSAVTTLIVWGEVASRTQSLFLGITVGCVVWASAGAVQLVNLTAFQGEMRAQLITGLQDARDLLEQRRRDNAQAN
ncbi:MAG: hypothetical protein PVG83_10895 [Acidimicrobiia bacterium]|jgi:hypothetical protein